MYARLCLLVLLVVAVATSAASAAEPSFSCAAARNWDERAICADAELAALDVDLDRAFRTARAALPDQAEAILRDQRAWLGIRARVCRERGGTVGAAAVACLAERTNARMAELIRLREPAPAAASLQHLLSRGASGGAVGEASLAAGESGPQIAVAAILAFARGDRAEATRRIEEAESKVLDGPGFDNFVSGLMGFHTDIRLLDEWATDPSLAEGPKLLRRAISVLRRHDAERKIGRPSEFNRTVGASDLYGRLPWGNVSRFYFAYEKDQHAYALKLPCRILELVPEATLDAFSIEPTERLSEILDAVFDCAALALRGLPEGRAFLNQVDATLERGEIYRRCGSASRKLDLSKPSVPALVALHAPRAVLGRLGTANPSSSPAKFWPKNPQPFKREWANLTRALAQDYVSRDGLTPPQASRLANAALAAFVGPDCAPADPEPQRPLPMPESAAAAEHPVYRLLLRSLDDPDDAITQLRGLDTPEAKAALGLLLQIHKRGEDPLDEDKAEQVAARDELLRLFPDRLDQDQILFPPENYTALGALIEHVSNTFLRTYPCALAVRYPALIEMTINSEFDYPSGRWPVPDCDLSGEHALPKSVWTFFDLASGPSQGAASHSFRGWYAAIRVQAEEFQELVIHLAPALMGKRDYVTRAEDWLPYEAWSYLSLDNRQSFDRIVPAFRQALDDLARHYTAKFGIPASQARTLARRALAVRVYDGNPVQPERTGLRHLIMSKAPTADIAAFLAPFDALADVPAMKFDPNVTASGGAPDPVVLVAVGRPDVMRLLLAKRADPNLANRFGKTAAMAAAQANDISSLRAVLAGGARVHARLDGDLEYNARTALHYAAASGGIAAIRLLIEAGADKHQPDSKGLRPINYLVGDGPVPRNRVLSDADYRTAVELLR